MTATHRKKPVEIEAMRLDPDTRENGAVLSPHDFAHARIAGWLMANGCRDFRIVGDARPFGIEILTREGTMTASPGDWIVREPSPTTDRKFYPVKPEIFAATYDAIETEEQHA